MAVGNVTLGLLSLVVSILFLVSTYFVLRNSRTRVNLFFAFSTITFAIATFIAAIGYFETSFESLWGLATLLLVIGPSGLYFSGKIILHGWEVTKSQTTTNIAWGLYICIISIVILLFYETTLALNIGAYWDFFIVIGSAFGVWQYVKLYLEAPELRRRLAFLIGGALIAMLGLLVNLVIIVITTEGTLLRQVSPILGWLIVVISFTTIPDRMRESHVT